MMNRPPYHRVKRSRMVGLTRSAPISLALWRVAGGDVRGSAGALASGGLSTGDYRRPFDPVPDALDRIDDRGLSSLRATS